MVAVRGQERTLCAVDPAGLDRAGVGSVTLLPGGVIRGSGNVASIIVTF